MNKTTGCFIRLSMLLVLLAGAVDRAAAGGPVAPETVHRLGLTPREHAWLKAHDTIRVRVSSHYPPFIFMEEGQPGGIGLDYIRNIAGQVGLTIVFSEPTAYTEALERMKTGDGIDLQPVMVRTAERASFLTFTRDYLTFPLVIFIRRDAGFIAGMDDLAGKTVAVERGYVYKQWIERDHPLVRIMTVAKSEDALVAVSSGRADAYMGNLAVGSFLIDRHGLANLKVAAPAPYGPAKLAMGIRKDWSELAGIIDKALAAMPPAEHNRIRQEWLAVRYEHGISNQDVIRWIALLAAAAGLLVTGFYLWNRRLKAEVRERMEAEAALRESEERYRRILETVPDAITITRVADGRLLAVNDFFTRLSGYSRQEAIGRTPFDLNLFVDTADRERLVRTLENEGEVNDFRVRYRPKDRSPIDMLLSARPLQFQGEDCMVVVAKEITHIMRTKAALKESETRYRTLFEKAEDAIFILEAEGADAGRIVEANPAAARMHGCSLEHLLTLNIKDLDTPDAAQRAPARIRRILDGEWIRENDWHRKTDGTVFPVEINAGLVELGGRRYIFAFDRDLSEQKEAEAALQNQLIFLQTLIETIPNPIFYRDPAGRFLGCNSAFQEMLGKTKARIVGRSIHDVLPRAYADKYAEADRRLIRDGGSTIEETVLPFADGTAHDVILSKAVFYTPDNVPGGVVGVVVDITDQKRTKEQSTLLAAAVEHSPEIIFITDTRGAILYVNAAFETLTGYTREEVLERSVDLLASDDGTGTRLMDMRNTLRKGMVWKGNLTQKRRDGSTLTVESSVAPVHQSDNAGLKYVVVQRDITEELIREHQFRQAQKMEAIGTLAGGIAHDFNNILSAIIGYSEIALQDTPAGSPSQQYLNRVLKAGERARDLIAQILAFSRQSEQEKKPVRVESILKEALKLLRASLPSYIEFRSDIQPGATIFGDPVQIHQVIMNLCTNAGYAMQNSGGVLTVNLHAAVPAAELPPTLSAGTYMRLSVADTGEGIPPDIIDRIFDPFFTTKDKNRGTGMGLSVVHGIVKSGRGEIVVESEPGKGTTFTVYLPVIEADEAEPAVSEVPILPGTERILYVDDEVFQVDIIKQMLERLGYRVTGMNSSLDALALFRKTPGDFDLVITDMTMPHLPGDELGRALLEIRPELPIIACTGYSERLTEQTAAFLGFCGFIMKPIVLNQLAGVIRKILDGDGAIHSAP